MITDDSTQVAVVLVRRYHYDFYEVLDWHSDTTLRVELYNQAWAEFRHALAPGSWELIRDHVDELFETEIELDGPTICVTLRPIESLPVVH